MITRLRLKNWKSHKDSEFRFSGGVNVIIGIMGSGKSSIMQGIAFALYGTFPAHQNKKLSLEHLIMDMPGGNGEKQAEVELDFSANDRVYTVHRIIQRDKGTVRAELKENNRVVESSPHAVNREIERILQMDYELFSRAVYSEQDGLDYFLNIPKGHRMRQIDRMLKVDRFETAREGAVRIKNMLEDRRREKVRFISDMEKENLGERIAALRREINGIRSEQAEAQKSLSILTKKRGEISEETKRYESAENEINGLRNAIERVTGAISELDEQHKRLSEKTAKIRKEDLEKDIKEISEKTDSLSKKQDELRNRISESRARIAELRRSMESLDSVDGTCPVCDSDVTPETKKEINTKRKKEAINLEEDVYGLSGELNRILGEIKSREEELSRLRLELHQFEGAARDLEEIHGKKKRALEGKERFESRLREVEADIREIDIKKLQEEMRHAIEREGGLRERVDALTVRISDKEGSMKELERENKTLERYRAEAKRDMDAINSLESFVHALKNTQDRLREEFLATVNSLMNSIWGELYPYGDFDGIRLHIDNDYLLQLRRGEDWISAEGMVSGGERSMACLALRIAFSLAFIPNLRWLMLDEPTHNLDENAITHLADILKEKIHSFTSQVFLITHEDRISDGVTGHFYKLERQKELNEPTRVVGF